MDKIEISKDNHKPNVIMDPEMGYILLEGTLAVSNSVFFFKPLLEWVVEYGNTSKTVLKVDFKLWYFNSSASKLLMKMFEEFKTLENKGIKIDITWYYVEDDEMLEIGQDMADMSELDFSFKTL